MLTVTKFFQSITLLNDEEKLVVEKSYLYEKLERGAKIITAGKKCNRVYFLGKGYVKQVAETEHAQRVIYIYTDNHFFTDLTAFLHSQISKYHFICLTDVEVFSISKDILDGIGKNSLNLEKCRRVVMENICVELLEYLESFYFLTPEQRFNQLITKNAQLFQLLPNKDIASIIGIQPESLSRLRKRIIPKS